MAMDDGTINGAGRDESQSRELWISGRASIKQLHRCVEGVNG